MSAKDKTEDAKTCGLPMDVHVVGLVTGMLMVGLGSGCEDTYKAIVEVAEGIRKHHGYVAYVPAPDSTMLEDAINKIQAAEDKRDTEQTAKVVNDYGMDASKLTPEELKLLRMSGSSKVRH